MPLFRKKREDEPVDMNERSPQLGVRYKDLAVLGQLMENGALPWCASSTSSPSSTLHARTSATVVVATAIAMAA